VTGDLDVSNAHGFIEVLFAAVERPGARVIVDLQQSDFIDSTVLNALFACRPKLRAADGGLALVSTSTHLDRVLEAAGVDAAYPIVGSRTAALELLTASG
jgi:anti-sigma B factor antagonist